MAGAEKSKRPRKSPHAEAAAFHFVDPPSRANGPPQPPGPPEVEIVAEAIPASPLELDEVVELDEIVELDPADLEILDVEPPPAVAGMVEVPFTFDLDEPEPPAAAPAVPHTFLRDQPGPTSPPPPHRHPTPPLTARLPQPPGPQPPAPSPSAKRRVVLPRPAAPVGGPVVRGGVPRPLSGGAAPVVPAVDPGFLEPETGLIPEYVVRRRPAVKLTFVAPGERSPLASS